MASNNDQRLGKYLLKSRLRKGGMGVVYLATDTRLKRDVALKVLPKELASNPDAVRRFLREARAAARLSHPNVVAIHDVDQQRGVCFLVMELLTGGTAQDLIQSGPIAWREATQIIADACRGLVAAHEAGLIHRDIKPSNIMRSAAGVVKLADFGLAKVAEHSTAAGPLTRSGTILGTPSYMSPEQCQGEELDARSDLYSLGATYFALLTGEPPFTDPQPLQVMFAHCSKPLPDPRTLCSDMPIECATIVAKAMAKSRADRFGSASELLTALNGLLERTTAPVAETPAVRPACFSESADTIDFIPRVATRPESSPEAFAAGAETGRWTSSSNDAGGDRIESTAGLSRRMLLPRGPRSIRPLVICLASALFLVVIAGLVWNYGSRAESTHNEKRVVQAESGQPASDASMPAQPGSGGPISLAFGAEIPGIEREVRHVAFSWDGKSLYAASRDGSLREWSIATLEMKRELTKSPQTVHAVAANQHWLAAGGDDQIVWLWNLASDQPPVALELESPIQSLAISPDGTRLAIGASSEARLYQLSDKGATLIRILGKTSDPEVSCYMVFGLSFSSDNRWLAATTWDLTVAVWNATTGALHEARKQQAHDLMDVVFLPNTRKLIYGALNEDGLLMWDLKAASSERNVTRVSSSQGTHVRSLAVTSDGLVLVVGGWNEAIRIYNVATDEVVGRFQKETGTTALGIAIAPDGSRVAEWGGYESHSGKQGYVHVWNVVREQSK